MGKYLQEEICVCSTWGIVRSKYKSVNKMMYEQKIKQKQQKQKQNEMQGI